MRRMWVLVAVFVLVGSACSSDSGGDGAASDDATSDEAASDSTATAPSADVGFEIPGDLLDRVDDAGFEVVDIDYPEQPDGVPWPTEDWPTGPLPEGVDQADVDSVVDKAFTGSTGDGDVIDAFLVVDDGKLVVEEYNGWDPEERHNSWSMAKSITSSMVGILEGRDEIDIFEPATAAEWADPEDPRHEITVDQLLRMSSGLEWEEDYSDPEGDVLTILGDAGKADRAGYAAAKPLEAEPDTSWEYSTGTADIVAREVGERVGFGDEYAAWIQANLFDPLGIPGADLQIDDAGVINGGSWINMRPVDFARFGYLFLRGGEWDGEQLVSEEWVDYSRLPTPTGEDPVYGAHWWLREDRPDVFYASGFNGQEITVVPDEDLVMVTMSTSGTDRPDLAVSEMLDLFDPITDEGG